MSCRHDLANTTCARCYPDRGGLDSNGLPQIDPGPGPHGPNLDGPGAAEPLPDCALASDAGRALLESHRAEVDGLRHTLKLFDEWHVDAQALRYIAAALGYLHVEDMFAEFSDETKAKAKRDLIDGLRREHQGQLEEMSAAAVTLPHLTSDVCPTYYDGCHCEPHPTYTRAIADLVTARTRVEELEEMIRKKDSDQNADDYADLREARAMLAARDADLTKFRAEYTDPLAASDATQFQLTQTGRDLERADEEVVRLRGRVEERDRRQLTVANWCAEAFGAEQASSVPQRALRFLEEAVELFQAAAGEAAMAHRLIDYVFSRPISQERFRVHRPRRAPAAASDADDGRARQMRYVVYGWMHPALRPELIGVYRWRWVAVVFAWLFEWSQWDAHAWVEPVPPPGKELGE